MKTLVIYAPCLDNPFLVYIGARNKEIETTRRWTELKDEFMRRGVLFFSYFCPETIVDGWPRPPASKDYYAERIPMWIVEHVKKIVSDVRPDRIVFVGIRNSPVCGVVKTVQGDVPKEFAERFREANMEERIAMKKGAYKYMSVVDGPGALMEILKKEFPDAVFVDLNKGDLESGFEEVRKAIEGN